MSQEFIFTGFQGYNTFTISVIADTVEEARQRTVNSLCVTVRKELLKYINDTSCKNVEKYKQMLEKVPFPTLPSDPIDDQTGNYCHPVRQFFEPIFTISSDEDSKFVPFDVWIKTAEFTSKQHNPHVIRVYSCLDG